MNFKEKLKQKQGITLIALVVTIIVLLILAGITIAMLTGQNGILNRATEAKDANGTAQIDEQVKLAVAEALSNGLGTITEDNLRAALDNNVGAGNYTLTGDATNGWTIKAGEKEYKINGNGNISGGDNSGGNTGGISNPNYSENVADADIIPDLFMYEVIDENAKTARITGMNPIYCNGNYYNNTYVGEKNEIKYAKLKTMFLDSESFINNYKTLKIANGSGSGSGSGSGDLENGYYPGIDTNYNINYKGKIISDTMIVPYEKEINGEIYTITEASITVKSANKTDNGTPNVNTIIFPNTIRKIYGNIKKDDGGISNILWNNSKITKIVLPNKLEEIGEYAFCGMSNLTEMEIPDTVKTIGERGLSICSKLEEINAENVTQIGESAFANCISLKKINIPKVEKLENHVFYECVKLEEIDMRNVTEIGSEAFEYCRSLKEIDLSKITKVGYKAFCGWKADQKIKVPFASTDSLPTGWGGSWDDECNAQIIYTDTNT